MGRRTPPYGPDNNATNVSLNGFEISAHSANKDAAWEWVKFIGTTEARIGGL